MIKQILAYKNYFLIKDQSLMITQHSDQERTIDELKNKILDLKKQLKHTQRQNSQLQIDMKEEKKNLTVEKEIEIRKRQFQDDFKKQVIKIGKISDKCEDLNREQKYQNELIKQKNEEIRILLQENDQLRRIHKEHKEQIFKIQSLEEENRQLKDKLKNFQEDMDKLQAEKKESFLKLKDEISKAKVENIDLMETINKQLVELSDCINLTNKYKEIILSQQKNIEISNKTNSEANEIIVGLDELVRSTSKKKNIFLVNQGDSTSTYDILYILKNNILSLAKQYQDIKQSKKKYKNKCQFYTEEIRDLKEMQKQQKLENEQLKTESLLLQQQFDQTVILMEQQINERNIEEMKLKQQLIDITSKISDLQNEFEEFDSKKYQEMSQQFGQYVQALHCKTAKLLNEKQVCGSFVSGYLKLMDKMNGLAQHLNIFYTNSNNSVKQKALRKLKKVFKAVFFAQLIKSRRSLLKIDVTTVNQAIKQSQKYQYKMEKLELQKDFSSIVNSLNVQNQDYYPYSVTQQQSSKITSQIEQNIQQKIQNKESEIDVLKLKFEKLSEELYQFSLEKDSAKNVIEDLRKKNFELEFESKRLSEENHSLNEQLKFHRQHFVQENYVESAKLPSQDNFYQSGVSSRLSKTDGYTQNNYESKNKFNNIFLKQDDTQNKLSVQIFGSNKNLKDHQNKNQISNFESCLNSPAINNNNDMNSNIGSFDFLKFQSSQKNSNQKSDQIRNNIFVDQDQNQNIFSTDNKKLAYLELKKQQQILEQKLSSNQNEIEKIRSNSQTKSRTASKRQSVDLVQDSFKFNTQQFQNQLNNQKNPSYFSNQSASNQYEQNINSSNNHNYYPKASLYSNNNNYTFNNNSSAQLVYSDSQRKARTIQDLLKQELFESQKFSKFLTQQE
ncbi:hypothetical protein TTHERM_00149670 (macronuclear) [Tetrahymena thermophila SB210]|uniref:Uncharacterized protein n=1 Tax=Tetrahymena thermophila (strain SB210) TaxID=312017 RepID=I7MGD5_TETTS|nr:hypothetical protein TTHERM_00149670 [Tetrahymena thermophila SB210]EAS01356.2 hypothetical protein TTHERM_00149670 [Tetrahymena thermophila SB210]|eukprot:XP_001021602.2 hypothetical protein TTHERM_00149670 [Tetrahymena thermophila SB210]